MKSLLGIISICALIHMVAAPPPRRIEPDDKKHETPQEKEDTEDFGLEYNRYLKEVIDLLESDPEFKKKLESAQEADIRSGQIAKELEFVDHKVRTKLDEVKRQELERLRHLAQKQYELSNGIDTEHVKVSSEHLDHENPHTFEMEDLKKLIEKVSSDLNEADRERRQEFKEYEMQKEFEKQQKLKHLEGSEKEAFEKQIKENETKHKQHEPLHHPGSKQQLEEVWEKQDHMENQEFDPKVFFQLHDLDGNGFWDHNEVKTLFLKELDKMYEAGAPEDDMKERVEEMERMREHVFSEADKNKDGLISYEEFIDKTKQPDFEKDPGWESLDQKPVYTPEEYQEFERRRQEEVQKLIQQGLIPSQPVFHPGQGYHPQYIQYHPPQYQAYQPGHGYPPQAQPPYRYAQDFSNQQPTHEFHQQVGGHPNPPVGNQHYQQGHHNQPQHYQQPPPSQGQGYQSHGYQQQHPNQAQGYQQQHPNQAQGYQQQHPNQAQGYQQQHPNQAQGYQQPHPNQAQGHQQPHPNQAQGYQKPHPNQAQGYQQPSQNHQPSHDYHQQEQGHQNQQGYQQQDQPSHSNQSPPLTNANHPSEEQKNQPPLTNANAHPNPPSQNQANQNYQNPPPAYQPAAHDPNEIHPQQPDPKYSKTDAGNSHPNEIDSQQKKIEHTNEHQPKLSNP